MRSELIVIGAFLLLLLFWFEDFVKNPRFDCVFVYAVSMVVGFFLFIGLTILLSMGVAFIYYKLEAIIIFYFKKFYRNHHS